jgi:hypothetical protein
MSNVMVDMRQLRLRSDMVFVGNDRQLGPRSTKILLDD